MSFKIDKLDNMKWCYFNVGNKWYICVYFLHITFTAMTETHYNAMFFYKNSILLNILNNYLLHYQF